MSSKKKPYRYKPTINEPQKQTTKNHRQLKFLSWDVYVFNFVLMWIFCAFVYDDVFYICQQNTYFAFDIVALKEITDFWYGWAVVVGRFLMLPFHYPLIGGAIFSSLLTGIAYLINYFCRQNWRPYLGFTVTYGWLFFLTGLRLNLFYQYEPSFLLYIPLLVGVILLIIWGICKFLTKKSTTIQVCYFHYQTGWRPIIERSVLLLFFIGLVLFAKISRQDIIATARMQRLLQQNQWEEMIKTAKDVSQPTRTVCAYYATALIMTDQTEKLFDIFYQYPDAHLYNRNDSVDIGTFFYAPDVYLYAGLLNAAYHNSIDKVIMNGVTAYSLKNLFISSLLVGEIRLASKFLFQIDKMPFEQGFVKKYEPYLYNQDLIAKDETFQKILKLKPTRNSIEQEFVQPLFLGYYLQQEKPANEATLKNCIAASLYAKNLDNFAYYMNMFQTQEILPSVYEEGLAMRGMRAHEQIESLCSPAVWGRMQEMFGMARAIPSKDHKERGAQLRKDYTGMYSMYYLYQNIPDENYPQVTSPGDSENKIN